MKRMSHTQNKHLWRLVMLVALFALAVSMYIDTFVSHPFKEKQ